MVLCYSIIIGKIILLYYRCFKREIYLWNKAKDGNVVAYKENRKKNIKIYRHNIFIKIVYLKEELFKYFWIVFDIDVLKKDINDVL